MRSQPLPDRPCSPIGRALLTLLSAGSLTMAGHAAATGFSDIELNSYLGQPLRARITLLGDGQEWGDGSCLSLVADRSSDGVPVLNNLRWQTRFRGGQRVIELTSPGPINEPAARLTLASQCGGRQFRRTYDILLDPPPAESAVSLLAPAPLDEESAWPAATAQARQPGTEDAAAPPRSDRNGLSLGLISVDSHLGEPLKLTIPVLAGAAIEPDHIDLRSVQILVPGSGSLSSALDARIESGDSGPRLVIRSREPVNEPGLSVEVQISARSVVSQAQWEIALDPPPAATAPPQATPAPGAPPAAAAPLPAAPAWVVRPHKDAAAIAAHPAPVPSQHATKAEEGKRASAAPSSAAKVDHVLVAAQAAPDPAQAAQYAELTDRVKHLNDDIARLRAQLASEQAQGLTRSPTPASDSSVLWIVGLFAAVMTAIAGLLGIPHRRMRQTQVFATVGDWPADDAGNSIHPQWSATRMAPHTAAAAAPAEAPRAPVPAPAPAPAPELAAATTQSGDPLTLSSLFKPIHVTEVAHGDPTAENIERLIADLTRPLDFEPGTTPELAPGQPDDPTAGSATPVAARLVAPASPLPAIQVPTTLDISLDLPDHTHLTTFVRDEARDATNAPADNGVSQEAEAPPQTAGGISSRKRLVIG